MHTQVIRQDRFGEPRDAFQPEVVPVPRIGPGEVLIAVMAAGINYNNVWAAGGIPTDVIANRQRAGQPYDFHIGGSDASGIVYATGDDVEWPQVGDHVVVHPRLLGPRGPRHPRGRRPDAVALRPHLGL